VLAAGILATPLVATDVPFAETPVIVPVLVVKPESLVSSLTLVGTVILAVAAML